MTEIKHTPGPWTIGDELEGDIFACGELLASAYPMKRDGLHESWRANARLMAAAPELLSALEDLLGDLPSVQGGICQHCGRDYAGDILCGDCPSDDCPSFKARAAISKALGAA